MPSTVFEPTQDTWMSSLNDWREISHGSQGSMRLNRRTGLIPEFSTRMLMQFDLSEIAKGSTINSASLVLNNQGVSGLGFSGVAVCYRMVYHGWTDGATYYLATGLAGSEWPGLFPEPDNPRNYAGNDYDPGSGVTVDQPYDLIFDIASYISAAISNDAGILSVMVTAPRGEDQDRFYTSVDNSGNPHPQLTIDFEPPSRTLTITYNDAAGGDVTVSSANHDPFTAVSGTAYPFQEDEVVTLVVNTNTGYGFTNWTGADSGDVSGSDPDFEITMDASKVVQANWDASTLKLTLNEGANGTDVLTPNGAAPLHTYEELESFLLLVTPDAGFQLDQVAVISGDSPFSLAPVDQAKDGNKHISVPQLLTQASEWTSSYKALWTLTTTIVGGANGTVTRGKASGSFTWPQEPLYAYDFAHIISIKPNVGYQANVQISAGAIINVKGTNLDLPIFGLEATDWWFDPPDSDATLTVTWTAIAAGQAGGGLYQKPFDDDKGRLIL